MSLLVSLIIVVLAAIFMIAFNGWCLQVVYNLGIMPTCEMFGVNIPTVEYEGFVGVALVIAVIEGLFNHNKEKTDITDKNTWSKVISVFLTKLVLLGFLWFVNKLIF